jgi:hypothetical protein
MTTNYTMGVVMKSVDDFPTLESPDDMVRSVRFKGPNWEKMLRLVEHFDRSPNYIVNKLVEEHDNQIPQPQLIINGPGHGGVSTYLLQIEFQIQDIAATDNHAHNVMAYMHDWLMQQTGTVASYERIDHLGPMEYDERFGYKQPFGYSKQAPFDPPPPSDDNVGIDVDQPEDAHQPMDGVFSPGLGVRGCVNEMQEVSSE